MPRDPQSACCTVCGRRLPAPLLELGPQPPANRFVDPASSGHEERYPLSLGACSHCGTAQLVDRMPLTAIRPRFDWLRNNEPEAHLDALADALLALPGLPRAGRIVGACYKDDSLLARLATRGKTKACRLDYGQAMPDGGGLEAIQAVLSSRDTCRDLRQQQGAVDLLILRHLVEHAESARDILLGARELLSPGGLLAIEVPDNSRIFRHGMHAFVWEEHFSYFTEASLRRLLAEVGARTVYFARYPYPYEDVLVAVLGFDVAPALPSAAEIDPDVASFAAGFVAAQSHWQTELDALRAGGERIAVFGAGHLAVKWINFYALAGRLEFVVDDHPAKRGLRMPGSRLPILPSSALREQGIRTCISSLSPESELRVRAALADYFARGGHLLPAFPLSPEPPENAP